MNKTSNKILIILSVAILLLGVYVYFSNDLNVQAADSDSSLVSSQSNSPVSPLNSASSDQISQDTAFLSTLISLTKIKIDTSIFSSTAFNSLNDNTVILESGIPGRPNPFAPVSTGLNPIKISDSPVVTNVPTQITNKAALLNGTTNNTEGVTSTYFEYGPTPTLGKITPVAKQSLIGTFGANITGLTPETTYFFRAVAKINGAVKYGDVISFNTN